MKGFWEKFYFRPGNLGYPVFDTAVGRIGVYICYDRHFPEGWRALGLGGAQIVFNPTATSRGLSSYLWKLEQPAQPRSPTSTSSARSTGSASRTLGDNDFYGTSYFVDPEGKFVGEVGDAHDPELIVRDLDMGLLARSGTGGRSTATARSSTTYVASRREPVQQSEPRVSGMMTF